MQISHQKIYIVELYIQKIYIVELYIEEYWHIFWSGPKSEFLQFLYNHEYVEEYVHILIGSFFFHIWD